MSGESIFRVKLLPDGRLEYEDCRGNVSACAPHELGDRVGQILRDPNLPPIEVVGAGGYNLADAAAKNLLPPQYQPLVRGLAPLWQVIRQLMSQAAVGRHPRYQRPPPGYQQQHQQRQQPDPRDPVFRRGRRVV